MKYASTLFKPLILQVAFLLLVSLLPTEAISSSPIANVGKVTIRKSQAIAEFRAGYVSDHKTPVKNNSLMRFRQQYDYGFTDQYAIRLLAEQDDPAEGRASLRNLAIHHRFHLIDRATYGWDGGIRIVYQHFPNAAEQVHFRLLSEVPFFDNWRWRHNTILRHEVGGQSRKGISMEFRNQVALNIMPYYPSLHPSLNRFLVGMDMFNNIGQLSDLPGFNELQKQIGPFLRADLNNGLFLTASYRVGVTSIGGDHLFKLIVGRVF